MRFSLLGVALVALIGVGLGIAWWQFRPGAPAETAAAPPPMVAALPPAARPEPPSQAEIAPSFDAVHIAPDGQAVIAGRAAPGAEVTVLDGDRVVGKVEADPNGEWVLTPDQPLPAGPHQLSLAARQPGAGGEPAHSSATVAVIVPERPSTPGQGNGVVAILLPHGDAAALPVQVPGRAGRHLVLDILEYQASGTVVLSGRSDPAAKVAIFVDDRKLGTAEADGRGGWSDRLAAGVPFGRYRLRLEAYDGAGARLDQLSFAMRRAAAGELAPGDYIAVVPGNNLWHVAQQSYGAGDRFVEIYHANPQRISDPNLIYPGQFLALPAKQTP